MDVRERRCNSEKLLIFVPCILRKTATARKAPKIKQVIWSRLNAWVKGDFDALVKDLDDLAMQDGLGRAGREGEFDVDAEGRRYNNMVLEGRISEAVNTVVDTNRGRLYQPDDACSKTGRMVIDNCLFSNVSSVVSQGDQFVFHSICLYEFLKLC